VTQQRLDAPLVGDDLVDDPYPFWAQLRRDGPVWHVPGTCAYFVSTWDLVAEATARVADFSNHFRHTLFTHDDGTLGVIDNGESGAPDVFAGEDPPLHTEHRKVFFPEMMQQKMETLAAPVGALVDGLLDDLPERERVDAAAMLTQPLPMRVIAEHVIGFRAADVAQIQRWVFAGSRFAGGRLTLDEMAALGAEAAGLLPFVTAQLDDALATDRRGDVLSAAAGGVRDGVFSHAAAAFTLMILLGAGGEPTVSLIGNAICVLAERPALQQALRADPARVPALVEEVLRFESPFRFHPRTAAHDTELGGVAIPERSMVALLWSSANRDERVFEQPDDVVIDRANAPLQLGFGRGVHHCVGAPLARLEARIALTKLLERTREFALDPDDPPRWTDNLWLRRHDRVPILVERA
jgi:cytochrome P450